MCGHASVAPRGGDPTLPLSPPRVRTEGPHLSPAETGRVHGHSPPDGSELRLPWATNISTGAVARGGTTVSRDWKMLTSASGRSCLANVCVCVCVPVCIMYLSLSLSLSFSVPLSLSLWSEF